MTARTRKPAPEATPEATETLETPETAAPAPETPETPQEARQAPEAASPAPETAQTPTPQHVDVVAMPSLRADGTPDQTEGFVHLLADEPEQA